MGRIFKQEQAEFDSVAIDGHPPAGLATPCAARKRSALHRHMERKDRVGQQLIKEILNYRQCLLFPRGEKFIHDTVRDRQRPAWACLKYSFIWRGLIRRQRIDAKATCRLVGSD